jgi:hypothetical protein
MVFIFSPPLPHARELKVVSFFVSSFFAKTLDTAKRDCGPRRSPGLAALRASILPASSVKFPEMVQWLACEFPPYSRAAATARSWLFGGLYSGGFIPPSWAFLQPAAA